MIGDIDYTLRPIQPQYFLCKPDREIIGKISEAFDDKKTLKINEVSTLELTIPFSLDVNHRWLKNKNIDNILERYLIKVVEGYKIEWFIIKEVVDQSTEDNDIKTVKCNSLSEELADKSIKTYEAVSYHAKQVMDDILANTIWNIGSIDVDFQLTYRTFNFTSTTVLDAIYTVAETYNAIVRFDTNKRTVDLIKPELFGNNLGLTFSYSKYLKEMNITSDVKSIVTRLKAFGQDDMGIQNVNPTGQNYIEDFSYWIYPFKRDKNRTVIQSSYYLSDSLCHALLDYAELLKSKKGLYDSYLKERQGYEKILNQLNVELNKLLNDNSVLGELQITQQFDGKMFFEKYQHSGNSSRTFELNVKLGYAVMIKVDNANGVNVSIDGSNKTIQSGKWILLDKFMSKSSTTISVSGGTAQVFMQVAFISKEELESSNNSEAIIDKYNYDNKENQIRFKKEEIQTVEDKIADVKKRISILQHETSESVNFTNEHLKELNPFVIEREFSDSKYIDEEDLLKAAQEKFKELQVPQLNMSISVVNFLEIIESQHDWEKLNLGDFVNVKYEPIGVNVTARITEITYDYKNSDISLVVANVKKVSDENKRLEQYLKNANATSVIVDTKKNKWGQAVVDSNDIMKQFEDFRNKITNEINIASNEYVDLSRKGLTITDPNDPLKFLRATHGILAMTDNGGLSYRTAITPTHIVADNVWGKLFVGERLTLGDIDGLLEITGPKFMIFDRCHREVQRIGLLSTNPDRFGMTINRFEEPNVCGNEKILNKFTFDNVDGFKLERNRNGTFEKTLYTSPDGDLFMKGNFQAGEGERVFRIDKDGLALGSSNWSSAPFHADYLGNVWMSMLHAVNADISDSVVVDSKFQVGSGNSVVVIDRQGLRLGNENIELANAAIYMDGRARFRNILLTKPDGRFLADTNNGKFDLNGWDLIGAGMIDTQLLAANIVTATEGFVSSLVAGKLSTLTNAALTDWSNYIRIESNEAKWITGKVNGAGTQKKLADGRALYWKNSTQSGEMTVDETEWPVLEYSMEEKVKAKFSFDGSGDAATPYIQMGIGDGATEKSGKGFINKPNGSFDFLYGASNTGKERSLKLTDEGILLKSDSGKFNVLSKDVNIIGDQGEIKISNGKASIVLSADGKITFNGTRYDFM
ncbi:phage tail protein [Paenibacillus sp. EKM202P]|uniref:phage tail spike protein n=1 Tax=Paenibacillus sp. EKM202P TaxID=1683670 RepID=UPI0013EA166D|nr:phage tail spike protein [Paenibacillus sp. EKM202P]KAF6565460.1 phage tail protein [Paenibacillus sp. EKM202P]KAF6569215.1 phage tail protein [Paenibacillus sp. EKM207P]